MIPLSEEHKVKIKNSKNIQDAYFVDVLLKDGTIKYKLSAREKTCLEATSVCRKEDYNFKTEDIEDIRPSISFIKQLTDPWKQNRETQNK